MPSRTTAAALSLVWVCLACGAEFPYQFAPDNDIDSSDDFYDGGSQTVPPPSPVRRQARGISSHGGQLRIDGAALFSDEHLPYVRCSGDAACLEWSTSRNKQQPTQCRDSQHRIYNSSSRDQTKISSAEKENYLIDAMSRQCLSGALARHGHRGYSEYPDVLGASRGKSYHSHGSLEAVATMSPEEYLVGTRELRFCATCCEVRCSEVRYFSCRARPLSVEDMEELEDEEDGPSWSYSPDSSTPELQALYGEEEPDAQLLFHRVSSKIMSASTSTDDEQQALPCDSRDSRDDIEAGHFVVPQSIARLIFHLKKALADMLPLFLGFSSKSSYGPLVFCKTCEPEPHQGSRDSCNRRRSNGDDDDYSGSYDSSAKSESPKVSAARRRSSSLCGGAVQGETSGSQ